MGQQSLRQAARRSALDVQSKRRQQRAEREKRLEELAVAVLVAVRERDAAVTEAEARAGAALRGLLEDEGLSVREAVEWCGDEVSSREVARLRRLAASGVDHVDRDAAAGAVALLAGPGGVDEGRGAAAS